MYLKIFKRWFDLFLAIIGLLLLSPIFILITVGLYISDKENPFFIQQRVGKDERIFSIIKFKTMNNRKDASGNLLGDAERLTKIGKIIRKSSLDEIPQIINVFRGDMSFIGPRPLLVEYLPLYNDIQKKRHIVKPGITGWAQTNGRNAISWEQKFNLDIWYVENISFITDIKILFLTILKVFKFEGINASNHSTIEKFKGN